MRVAVVERVIALRHYARRAIARQHKVIEKRLAPVSEYTVVAEGAIERHACKSGRIDTKEVRIIIGGSASLVNEIASVQQEIRALFFDLGGERSLGLATDS